MFEIYKELLIAREDNTHQREILKAHPNREISGYNTIYSALCKWVKLLLSSHHQWLQ